MRDCLSELQSIVTIHRSLASGVVK